MSIFWQVTVAVCVVFTSCSLLNPIPNVPVFLIDLASELGRRSSDERHGRMGSEFIGLWLRMQESFNTVWARFGGES